MVQCDVDKPHKDQEMLIQRSLIHFQIFPLPMGSEPQCIKIDLILNKIEATGLKVFLY